MQTANAELTLDAVSAFLARVQRAGAEECWPWKGHVTPNGYGRLLIGSRRTKFRQASAHRLAFAIANDSAWPMPSMLSVCHRCDNRRCCNPAHLFLGTAKDNTRDMLRKGRQARKLTTEQVRELRAAYAQRTGLHWGRRAWARKLGLNENTIQQILTGKTWREVD